LRERETSFDFTSVETKDFQRKLIQIQKLFGRNLKKNTLRKKRLQFLAGWIYGGDLHSQNPPIYWKMKESINFFFRQFSS